VVNRQAELITGLTGFALLLGALAWEFSRLAEPLPEGLAAVLGAVGIAIVGALVGRWSSLLLSLVLIPVAGVNGFTGDFWLMFAIPATAILLALGVGVGSLVRRSPWTSAAQAATALLGVCVLIPTVATGWDVIRPPRDRTPEHPLTLNWRNGRFDGLALRMTTAAAQARLGVPDDSSNRSAASPVGEDYYEIGGPTSFGAPCTDLNYHDQTLRYEHLTVFGCNGSVYGWVTTSDRSQTPGGVGIGDDRVFVERRYPQADCYIANEGTEYATFPLCVVQVCKGRALYFGGEPIKSIWFIAQKLEGLGPCRAYSDGPG
jgi:hypothetical protein